MSTVASDATRPFAPDRIEIAAGIALGERRGGPPQEPADPGTKSPREALADLLIPALSRTPCLVAFSGGRDSSCLLAAATEVARRNGLDDPIPITSRYSEHPRTWEADWQTLVIRHLGLADWTILELTDELDAIGPIGGGAVHRHGVYWPPNAHSVVPLLETAAPGSLLTGNGGDESLTPWQWRRAFLIKRGRLRPKRFDLKPVALSLLPGQLRTWAWQRRSSWQLPWYTPVTKRLLQLRWGAEEATIHHSWGESILALPDSRYVELGFGIMNALADDAGTSLVQPFAERHFLEALARTSPREGYPTRSEALGEHFGDLLPSEVLSRSTKASFTAVTWGPRTREFVASWDGKGLDTELVDVEGLRGVWAGESPDIRSMTLLQATWLASLQD